MKPRGPAPFWNAYVGGALLGTVLFASFVLTGHGLGASGGIARVVVAGEKALVPGHVDRTALLAEMAAGTKNPLDAWVVLGILGVALGGAASGWLAGRWRLETFRGPRVSTRTRWLLALLGGTVMGFAARLARGCTSGQALTGGATLAVGSWVFMFAVFGGGYLVAYPLRRLWK